MKLIKFLRRKTYIIITTAARLIATVAISYLAAVWLFTAAYDIRGYFGVGGEWVLIIEITFAIWKLTKHEARIWWESYTSER